MKLKMLLFIGVMITILTIIINSSERAYTHGPCDAPLLGAEHSGAPGEVNCTGCHSGSVNSGPGSVLFDMGVPNNIYLVGQTYTAIVSFVQTNIDKFGFQICVLQDSNNISSGNLVITDVFKTRLIPSGTREYVGNTPCGADRDSIGYNTWTFDWQAPATNEGNLTCYLSALATNHSHSTAGDNTYTQTFQLFSNLAPVANDDVSTTMEDVSVIIDVQNNDTGTDPLTTIIISGPNNGTAVALNGDSIQYTPNPAFTGADTITYVICDNGAPPLCDTAIVVITVTPGVGVSNITDNAYFNVFPNPANQYLLIQSEKLQNKPMNINLMSLNGQNTFQYEVNDCSLNIDISNIPSGLYLIKINNNGLYKKILILH